jgi:hypothetical protein
MDDVLELVDYLYGFVGIRDIAKDWDWNTSILNPNLVGKLSPNPWLHRELNSSNQMYWNSVRSYMYVLGTFVFV